MTEQHKTKPCAWVYTNKRGDRVVHWYADTPRFVADRAAAQEWPESHNFTALYDQAAIDAAVAAERERCARVCDDEASIRTEAGNKHPSESASRGRCFAAARAAINCAKGVRNGEVV